MNTKDIPLTISEIQNKLSLEKFSVSELVEAYLKQIREHNDEYNIFLTVADAEARKKAKELDLLLGKKGEKIFEELPLFGVVVSYKDIFLTKGLRTTAASRVLENYIPQYSATVVEKIEAAGAICIGKVNCDAWAHGASGENSDFGPTLNPWDKEFVPGGSSSGSSAVLSANMSLFSLGSDTGGSTRQPANFCYLVGLKPTYGAISRYGVIAMSSSIDTVGTLARTVDDIERVFETIKGQDGYDGVVQNFEKKPVKKKLKIGVAKEYFTKGLEKVVEDTINYAIKTYEKMGVEIVEVSLPMTKYQVPIYYIIQPAEVSSNLGRFDGIRYGMDRSHFGEEAKRRIMLGSYVLSAGYYDAYYLKAQKVRTLLIKEFEKAFEEVDAIISPVSPSTAFRLGKNTSNPLKMYLEDVYTNSANLAGIPGLALPSGFTKAGMPVGFQLMGPRFSEYTLFELGRMYHKEIGYQPKVAF